MSRILAPVLGLFFLAVILSIQPIAAAKVVIGEESAAPTGVYCEINKVKLFAESAEDCARAGGVVTHTVSTTVKPAEKASDNPSEEPEIQRSKDKEPKAP